MAHLTSKRLTLARDGSPPKPPAHFQPHPRIFNPSLTFSTTPARFQPHPHVSAHPLLPWVTLNCQFM
ncbi:hypothetical protein PAXRUDRAFT_832624 [Paxillus rubicundulus Ve08.2h10]|uniref:Uncharacterized protein n=1 Tax=Paxillus rubicundulus Ve08.2h10 TaxID=930991 RepID=A0A0D0D139_9AGAM|nr:hypothetical protein PAXRUDRAFT_832624 [Paxillus rubicundulus Ve08.2h10]